MAGAYNLVGATVGLDAAGSYGSGGACGAGVWQGGCNWCNATYFDQTIVGNGLAADSIKAARTLQKVYYTGNLTASVPGGYTDFVKTHGGQLLVCCKPPQGSNGPPPLTYATTNDNAFQTGLSALISALGVANFRLVLYQEPVNNFTNNTYYWDYFNHYGKLIREVNTSVVICYDTNGFAAQNVAIDYYPGDLYVDYLCCDFYQTSYRSGNGVHLDQSDAGRQAGGLQGLADGHTDGSKTSPGGQSGTGVAKPIQFGLGEIGWWAGPPANHIDFNQAAWTSYCNYIVSFFQARVKAGKQNGWVISFNSDPDSAVTRDNNNYYYAPGTGGGNVCGANGTTACPTNDPKIGGFQTLYAGIASQVNSTSGGGASGPFDPVLPRPVVNLRAANVNTGPFGIKLPTPRPNLSGGTANTPTTYAGTASTESAGGTTTPVLRAGSQCLTTGGTSLTLNATIPSGTQTGDIVGFFCCSCSGANQPTFSATGFTAVAAATGTQALGQWLYHQVTGSEGWTPGTTTITVTATTQVAWDMGVIAVGGASSSLFDPTPTVSGQANAQSLSIASNSITPVNPNDLLVWFGFVNGGASGGTPQTITLPSGYTAPSGITQANSTAATVKDVGLIYGSATGGAGGSPVSATGTVPTTVEYNGAMLIAFPGTSTGGGNTTLTTNVTEATAAGDALMAAVTLSASSGTQPTLTAIQDTQGNTYQLVYAITAAIPYLYVYQALGATKPLSLTGHLGGPDQVTAVFTNSFTGSISMSCTRVPGGGPADVAQSATGTSTAPSVSGTPANGGEVAYAVFAWATAGGTGTIGTPFTQLDQEHASGGLAYLTTAYDMTPAKGTALTASDTITSAAWRAVMVTLDVGGPPPSGAFSIALPAVDPDITAALDNTGAFSIALPPVDIDGDSGTSAIGEQGAFTPALPGLVFKAQSNLAPGAQPLAVVIGPTSFGVNIGPTTLRD